MDSNPEHAPFRASQIRPPGSRLPAASARPGTLTEFTESQNNVRAQPSMLPQPGLKRPTSGHGPQPDAKQRKTLMERAAEYPDKPAVGPSGARAANTRGMLLSAQSGIKQPSSITALSRHHSSASMSAVTARNQGNFSQSVGPGIGRSNSTIARAQTSMSTQQPSNSRQRANTTRVRPQTSMISRHASEEPPTGKNSWDVDERLIDMEAQFKTMKEVMNVSLSDKKAMEEMIEMAKSRVADLERDRNRLDERNTALQCERDELRLQVSKLGMDLDQERRTQEYKLQDQVREYRTEIEQLRRTMGGESENLRKQHQEEIEHLKRQARVELEDARHQLAHELDALKLKVGSEQANLLQSLKDKDQAMSEMRTHNDALLSDLDRERTMKTHLQKQMDELVATNTSLEGTVRTLQAQVHFLESDSKQQSDSFSAMEARMQEALRSAEEARQKLIKEETERRVLFNKYQELKGNIRVMCRVRPVLGSPDDPVADLDYPDDKTSAQICVKGPEEKNSLGRITTKTFPFEFDRVFNPQIANEEIFGEISQLVQSALDGYNVCIFCYGQTGSGKTYTMSSPDGMIPRATKMIYDTVHQLKEKSWSYTMEGNFIEVYNEELHDLLTPTKDQKKLEIRHDEARRTTTVLNCKSVLLDSENTVELMLNEAEKNRSVAATKSNERSSRSHSVFTLKLIGENAATHERCEGTLNLVDLAGSERLKSSGAEGDRMKETQNINTSLKSLGDVIEALGAGQKHIPYRNSKLTYLLRNSLGGNSKTLMFVMVSPLEAHLNETLSSLRFATKVHNTHIGTAKSTRKSA